MLNDERFAYAGVYDVDCFECTKVQAFSTMFIFLFCFLSLAFLSFSFFSFFFLLIAIIALLIFFCFLYYYLPALYLCNLLLGSLHLIPWLYFRVFFQVMAWARRPFSYCFCLEFWHVSLFLFAFFCSWSLGISRGHGSHNRL